MVITDSGFVYAVYNLKDAYHQEAMRFMVTRSENLLVPDVVLPEVCYLVTRDLGYPGLRTFLAYFTQLILRLEPIVMDDIGRVREIVGRYQDARFDIVDCCIMAMAERLNINRIATFDRRDSSIFKLRHCQYLDLLP